MKPLMQSIKFRDEDISKFKRHLKETTFIIVTHNKDIKELCQNNFVFEKNIMYEVNFNDKKI